ncbi:hypothetical protein KEM60_03134 [Austwickia sp. TVS 96-490-7B]|uniref:hypothetical protein n=1 Tax=Austwickia sp. TVS 96-490-7B TaxID=2830843 RepID=UPI001C597900|nr:hypothetical protein [Austwickia sp. TVS 96-490-7B]MBW3086905.1 hypothetical protein [Austwickia sp. TVS 96-490-7B]
MRRPDMLNKSFAVAASAVFVAALTGCSVDSSAGPVSPADAAKASSAWVEIQQRKEEVSNLETLIAKKCMKDAHYKVFPSPIKAIPDVVPEGTLSLTEGEAKKNGYRLSEVTGNPEKDDDDGNLEWENSTQEYKKKYSVAYFGDDASSVSYSSPQGETSISTTGCLAEARKTLYGDLERMLRLGWIESNELKPLVGKKVSADPDLADVHKKWSSCMKEKNFQYGEPAQARKAVVSLYEKGEREKAKSQEMETALADAQCQQVSGYVATYQAVEKKATGEVYGKKVEDIVAWRDMLIKARENGLAALR